MADALEALRDRWQARWPAALALWSRFTRLSDPRWCLTPADEKREGLTGSFAMIRLVDHAVVISLRQIHQQQLEQYALEVLAHEIGHHVYTPADLTDHARMIARMRRGLPTKEHLAPFISNLYTDLLINDRLQRSAGLSMAEIYRVLGGQPHDALWTFYMRIYEILWSLPRGSLTTAGVEARLEGDAQLGARLIRSYAADWLDGAGRFAALCLPYLLEDEGAATQTILKGWRDTENAGAGGLPDGLTEIDPGEAEGARHPALDDDLAGVDAEPDDQPGASARRRPADVLSHGGSRGQAREPFEYGQILRALGVKMSDHDLAVRYYRERAAPHLIPFPTRLMPESKEPLPEGLEPWDIGSPLDAADWTESVLISPRIIPGFTTVQRVWGVMDGALPAKQALDLDLYVDCSGSMPNPQSATSFLTLAGTIVALSALRAGARVQATLWSGARQFITTEGFVRDEQAVLRILTGYLGGGTAFPIHVLRDTYADRKPSDRAAHILIISDDGVTTMFNQDEKGNSGWEVARLAMERARGGGTLVLNLWGRWEDNEQLARAYVEQDWQVHVVRNWEELVAFARQFSRLKYGDER